MKKSMQYVISFSILVILSIVTTNNILMIYGQDEEGDVETDSGISQLEPGLLTNDSVPLIVKVKKK